MLKLTPLEAKFTRGSNNDLVCSVENPAIIEYVVDFVNCVELLFVQVDF